MVTIFSTPSSPASLIESSMKRASSGPRIGCIGQAEQLIAASRSPREAIASHEARARGRA